MTHMYYEVPFGQLSGEHSRLFHCYMNMLDFSLGDIESHHIYFMYDSF